MFGAAAMTMVRIGTQAEDLFRGLNAVAEFLNEHLGTFSLTRDEQGFQAILIDEERGTTWLGHGDTIKQALDALAKNLI